MYKSANVSSRRVPREAGDDDDDGRVVVGHFRPQPVDADLSGGDDGGAAAAARGPVQGREVEELALEVDLGARDELAGQ